MKRKQMTKNPNIKLVIFDGYGVAFSRGYPDTMKVLAKRLKRDEKELQDVFYHKYFNLAAERKVTQKQAWIRPIKELGLDIDWREVRALHYKLFTRNYKVLAIVNKVQEETTTLMLSKNTRSQFYDTGQKLEFKKYFKNIINTYELNLPKASRKTMKLIMKRFKVKPGEIIFIDDQKNNLVEAKKMGVYTIFYKSFTQFQKDFNKLYYLQNK